MPVSCKTILRLHGNEGVVFRILVSVSIPCLLRRNKLNKTRKPNVSIIKGVGKTADCSSSVANLQLVILWSMRRLFSDQVRFMHLTILSRPGGGGDSGHGDLTFFTNLPSNSLPTRAAHCCPSQGWTQERYN